MNKLTTRDNIFNNHIPFDVKHNGFDLTHKVISSWDMGKLYPVSLKEVYPNDSFKTQIQWKMILETLQKPIYQNIGIKFREYETPYRILWKHWRNYYTGGRRGDYVTNEPKVNLNCASNIKNSIFDYFGFPLQEQLTGDLLVSAFPFVAYDFIYFWNFINPEFQENIVYNIQDEIFQDNKVGNYRIQKDELNFFNYLSDDFYINIDGIPMYTRMLAPTSSNLAGDFSNNTSSYGYNDRYSFTNCGLVVKEVNTSSTTYLPYENTTGVIHMDNYRKFANIGFLYNVNWEKDYFTSAHYNTQLGEPVSVPLSTTLIDSNPSGTMLAKAFGGKVGMYSGLDNRINLQGTASSSSSTTPVNVTIKGSGKGNLSNHDLGTVDVKVASNEDTKKYFENINIINTSFVGNDFRLMMALTQIKEGALLSQKSFEYASYLQYFFGRSPNTRELSQPIYHGGCNSHFYTSEVIQTSETTNNSALGSFGGKGESNDYDFIDKYIVDEIGLSMIVMFIVPQGIYQTSQGVNRQWLRNDRFDYYNPAFAHIGLQEVKNCEIYATGNNQKDHSPFGYTMAFDELRYLPDVVTSDMRDKLDIWHMGRNYSELPALNSSYLLCRPTKRIFQVQKPDVPNITGIINFVTIAYRDMPELAIPQLLDHRY